MKEITKEWLKLANDDLSLIEQIINEEHLTHLAAFHAQQSIEKCLKAIIEENELELEKIHNLQKLLNIIKSKIHLTIDIEIFKTLDRLYISARYPGDLGLLPDGKPTIEDTNKYFQFAKNIYEQVKQALDEDSERAEDKDETEGESLKG